MKWPLSVYVIKHPDFMSGITYAEEIYNHIFREVANQTNIKSDVPVFFSDSKELVDNIIIIDTENSIRTAVIVLIDAEMVLENDDKWKTYITKLYEISRENNRVRVFPVAISKDVMKAFPEQMRKVNFIRLFDKEEDVKLSYLIMTIRHELCRMLFDIERGDEATPVTKRPVKLFLSHAKRDGLKMVTRIRDYINFDTGINDFFDTVDIEPGCDFLEEIEANMTDSNLLIVFQTDYYSESEWCKKEVLLAKEKDIPLLVVDCLEKGELRSFPYIGNAKTLCFDSREQNIEMIVVSAALEVVLQKVAYKKILQQYEYIGSVDEGSIKYNHPELISLSRLKNEMIVYPEPPIGKYENELLSKLYPECKLLTPIMLFSKMNDLPLGGKKVAISISESEDAKQKGITKYYCHALALELSKYLIHSGAELLYGGDINYQINYNFTKTLIDTLENYCKDYNLDKTLSNYVAGYLTDLITREQQLKYYGRVKFHLLQKSEIINDEYSADELNLINKSNDLTAMREIMTKDMDVRIAVGGKKSGYTGRLPGVLEEIIYTLEAKKPLYIVGGFGGVAGEVANCLLGKDNWFSNGVFYDETSEKKVNGLLGGVSITHYEKYVLELKLGDLNNGLSDADNINLMLSNNINEIVALILKGMRNII